jgi:hypothetical protein
MKLTPFVLVIGLATVVVGAQAAGTANVNVQNKCDKPQAYKIETTGSALDTSLSPRASKSTKLNHGDRIKVGGSLVHTVAASSDGKTVIVCNK